MLNYLSLFSGIGAPEKALVNLGVSFHLVNYCEIDKYASKSYAAVHGVSEDINLQDVLTDGYTPHEKSKCLMCNDSHGYYNGCSWTPIKRFYRWYSKSFTNMIFPSKSDYERCLAEYNTLLGNNKPSAKLFDNYVGNTFNCGRYLWKEERARLQTVPEKYVECMSEKEAADLLGDGWTVDVIAHILKGVKDERVK